MADTNISSPWTRARPVRAPSSSTTAAMFVAQRNQEFEQIYPQPGWVEHDPEDIWSSQMNVARKVHAGRRTCRRATIAAIGITNQRETTVVWERGHRPARSTTPSSGRTAAPPASATT